MNLIIDTTYILPLARIGISTDLLKEIDEGKIKLKIDEIKINGISIFELHAKAAKSNIAPIYAIEAIDVINATFKVVPFYNPDVIKISNELLGRIPDYIDCIIVATAIATNEDLITEDRKINDNKSFIKNKYKINIFTYNEILKLYGKSEEIV